MTQLTVNVPLDIEHYVPELRYFMESMVYKLNTNRHKGFATDVEFGSLHMGMFNELNEATSAALNESQFAYYMECVDVANMAWLAALSALRMTKDQWCKVSVHPELEI